MERRSSHDRHDHQPSASLPNSARAAKIELIDVRTPVGFREVHVEMPAMSLGSTRSRGRDAGPQRISKDEPLYVICRSGGRGRQACEKFIRPASPMSSTSKAARWPASKRACRSFAARRPSRWSGRFASPPDRSSCWVRTRLVRPSGVHRPVGFRRRRAGVCRHHRYLRDGHDPGPHAVEPVRQGLKFLLHALKAAMPRTKESRS